MPNIFEIGRTKGGNPKKKNEIKRLTNTIVSTIGYGGA
jgi:hypothetical protein